MTGSAATAEPFAAVAVLSEDGNIRHTRKRKHAVFVLKKDHAFPGDFEVGCGTGLDKVVSRSILGIELAMMFAEEWLNEPVGVGSCHASSADHHEGTGR